MRLRTALAICLISSSSAFALPVVIQHSGYVLGAADAPLAGPQAMRFSIWTAVSDGSRVWASAPSVGDPACTVSVNAGYYAVALGDGCGAALTDDLVPAGADRFLELEIGGVVLSPRQALRAVPAATTAALALAVVAGGVTNAMLENASITVGTGTGLTGGGALDLGGSRTISLADTAVTAGSYTNASITVDAQGRLTAASSGPAPITAVASGSGTSVSTTGGTATVNLTDTTVGAGSYTNASITVDAKGRLTAASSGPAPITAVASGAGTSVSTAGGTATVNLTDTTVSAGNYTNASISVDAKGRLIAASSGTAPITAVNAGTGTSVSTTAGVATVGLSPSGVSVGTYTNATITVDASGRVTSAGNGSGGATPQLQRAIYTTNGTFTTPAASTTSTIYKVTVVGGGASGVGGGYPGSGYNGGTSSFGAFVSATGGKSQFDAAIGAGGAGVSGDLNLSGQAGSAISPYNGGATPMFGVGTIGRSAGASWIATFDGLANTGGGGAGNGSNGGGGAGGVAIKWVSGIAPSTAVTITVGTGGSAGGASNRGGAGGSGLVMVEWNQ